MNWRERISIDPRIHHGKPCIKGTRVPVSVIVGTVAEGLAWERIIESWPQLSLDDIEAALRFASRLAAEVTTIPLDADVDADGG
jgi:uncharacterized protein (DUF433 family)